MYDCFHLSTKRIIILYTYEFNVLFPHNVMTFHQMDKVLQLSDIPSCFELIH